MKKAVYVFGALILAVLIFVASGIRLDIPVEKLKARYANEHSRFIDIDGLTVHYRDEGRGVPLLLLHAAPSSLHTFDGLVGRLSGRYRVIRLDLPGYGLTGPNAANDYSLQWYMRFLESFLKALRVDSCYVAGNSFGGRLAAELAYEKPGFVKKLVLIDSDGYPADASGILGIRMARTPLLRPIVRYVTPRFFIAMNLKEVFGGHEASDETIDRYYDLLRRTGNRDTFIAVSNQKPGNISDHVRAIRIPTLILWGKADPVFPVRYAEYFHRDIPGSQVILYDGLGHMPQEVLPEKIAADIEAFLQ